jgi:hypothetical protein
MFQYKTQETATTELLAAYILSLELHLFCCMFPRHHRTHQYNLYVIAKAEHQLGQAGYVPQALFTHTTKDLWGGYSRQYLLF